MKQGGEFSHASPRCLTSTAGAFFDSPCYFDMFLGFRSRRGSRVGHPLSIFFLTLLMPPQGHVIFQKLTKMMNLNPNFYSADGGNG